MTAGRLSDAGQGDDRIFVSYGYNHVGLGSFFNAGWRGPREFPSAQPLGAYALGMERVNSRTIVFADSHNWHLGDHPDHGGTIALRHAERANFITAGGAVFFSSEVPDAERWFFGY